jgi:hypothetical protein
MRIHRISQLHARVQVSNAQMAACTSSPEFYAGVPPIEDVEVLLSSGAKAYFRGGGWWDVYGYAYDGSDIEHVITKLNNQTA